MSRHAERFLQDKRYRVSGQAKEYVDRKYVSPLFTEIIESQRKDRTRDVLKFANALQRAQHAARRGHCADATRFLADAKSFGEYLAFTLPNARREVGAKIRMVEREVVDRAHCDVRRKR